MIVTYREIPDRGKHYPLPPAPLLDPLSTIPPLLPPSLPCTCTQMNNWFVNLPVKQVVERLSMINTTAVCETVTQYHTVG